MWVMSNTAHFLRPVIGGRQTTVVQYKDVSAVQTFNICNKTSSCSPCGQLFLSQCVLYTYKSIAWKSYFCTIETIIGEVLNVNV